MKFAVIGASAGVGLELVKQLLEHGHTVNTLSRSIGTIPEHERVHRITGSALNEADIAQAIDGVDAILVTLGTGTSRKATGLYIQSPRAILNAIKATGAQPLLIVLTGFGAGDSMKYSSWPVKTAFKLLLGEIYAEKTLMEKMLAAQYPNVMFVRPGKLTNGALTGRYRVLAEPQKGARVNMISRKDVADFMRRQAENPSYIGQYPILTN